MWLYTDKYRHVINENHDVLEKIIHLRGKTKSLKTITGFDDVQICRCNLDMKTVATFLDLKLKHRNESCN